MPPRYTRIIVPSHVRQRLQPYSEVFESVVIPLAIRSHANRFSTAVKTELREAMEAYMITSIGYVPHPALMRYGLLLCCYHTLSALRPLSRAQAVVGRARRLIGESFRYYEKEDSLTLL